MLLQKDTYRKQSLDAPDKVSSVSCPLFAPKSVRYVPFFSVLTVYEAVVVVVFVTDFFFFNLPVANDF